ncbi:hypothetical protein [Lactobacillus sp. HT06-2]|uniref:hypothetical protein n=1 Tax=Lactobacillus sp. HT06-2 TaxID=2080222 RepID=UPI000CD8A896|nr:hypothetical protein [Lactobacillus sp. HT06-2]
MTPETKRFLRNRKLQAIVPWFGIAGLLVLMFSAFMSGFPLFLTEIGFVANLYYWTDEYNWIVQRILFNDDHIIDKKKEHLQKILLNVAIIGAIITTILLGYLRSQNFIFFSCALGIISGSYFTSRLLENFLWIIKITFTDLKKYYLLIADFTIVGTLILTILMLINKIAFIVALVVVGLLYVLEKDIISEMKKRNSKNEAGYDCIE